MVLAGCNVIHWYDIPSMSMNLSDEHRRNTFVPMTDRIKRRKPAHARKEAQLRVRVAESHMAEFQAAAARAGISLSAWVTERLLKCARQEGRHD
jgi:predicted DNA binding CopG/RHH family protein